MHDRLVEILAQPLKRQENRMVPCKLYGQFCIGLTKLHRRFRTDPHRFKHGSVQSHLRFPTQSFPTKFPHPGISGVQWLKQQKKKQQRSLAKIAARWHCRLTIKNLKPHHNSQSCVSLHFCIDQKAHRLLKHISMGPNIIKFISNIQDCVFL